MVLPFVFGACSNGPQLKPGPGAELLDEVEGAIQSNNRVTVEARTDAWRWPPQTLDEHLTPVLVTVHNGSDRPIRVQYADFGMKTQNGETLVAMAPHEIGGRIVVDVSEIDRGAQVYSDEQLTPFYEGADPVAEPYDLNTDPVYYETFHTELIRVDLPTRGMVRRALPQGVLEPGGTATGFIYFEHVDADAEQVEFTYQAVDTETKDRMAYIAIPFEVE